tara:strand:- start:33180 stop:33347 length:168 start_codon:yes stop_codon:yes gene_type:complete
VFNPKNAKENLLGADPPWRTNQPLRCYAKISRNLDFPESKALSLNTEIGFKNPMT